MIQAKSFYEGFQINHYDIKQINNKKLLELPKDEIATVTNQLINGDPKEYFRTIKMDIRFTYLLAIETLFEIIFSLIPENDNQSNDHQILKFLTRKKDHYKELRNYANDSPSKLDKLNRKALLRNGEESDLWSYMFFLGLGGNEFSHSINSSIDTIKNALKLFAKDLSDRDEINGYKHGLRGIRHLVSFQLGPKEVPNKTYMNFATEDALSFYSFDKETNEHVIKSMEFDHERDIKMTHLASNILYNIIEPRKYLYGDRLGEAIYFKFFSKEELQEASKVNIKLKNLTFRYQVKE